jgi:hypothetical protein
VADERRFLGVDSIVGFEPLILKSTLERSGNEIL